MKLYQLVALALGLAGGLAQAAPPASAPAGATGLCNDGSYYSKPEKKGACRGHKGVKEWYGAQDAAAPASAAAPSQSPAPAAAATPAAPVKPAPAPATAAAPGGGSGKVWVNTDTQVYHCMGDRWYGKTKTGEYMSEGDAKAKGAKPSHGKSCS